jgi:23S rRNA (uracil1939-C5)-methyltransferase
MIKKRRRPSVQANSHHGPPPIPVTVDSLAWGGRGVGRNEGKVIFVSKGVPGDRLLIQLQRVKSHYAEGRIQAVLQASPDRVEPKCKFFSHCGGCQWLAVRYARQLAEKEALVKSILRRHLSGCEVLPIVPSDPPRRYRHRGDLHVRPSGKGAKVGFFQESSHQLVNLDECLLFDRDYNAVYGKIRKTMQEEPSAAHVERLTLARSEAGDQYVALLWMRDDSPPAVIAEVADWIGRQNLSGALLVSAHDPSHVFSASGTSQISYSLQGEPPIEVRADIRSFTQAHFALNKRLVEAAKGNLALSKHERVLDLYSGVGNFTLPLAAECREVVAVEENPIAHENAKDNARRGGIHNIKHLPGDSGVWVTNLASASERFDAVLLDPPRDGAKGIVEALGHLSPRRILYVSCNLPSLDRDLQALAAGGFRPVRLQPWDLFPQTYSVETMCLLTRA